MRRTTLLTVVGLLFAGCTAGAPVPSTPVPSAATTVATPTSTPTESASAPTESEPEPTPTEVANPCLDGAAALSPEAQVGQLLMVGVEGSLDAAESRAITDHQVGSVVLLGDQSGGVRPTMELTGKLAELNPDAGTLVAADQEGGRVQRLTGPSWTRIPSADRQAKLSDVELREAAAGWGALLARAGVLLNLAPVADVVPKAKLKTNQPIGRLGRGYGTSPAGVTAKTAAVIAGLQDAGVAATVKHFPGLGEVVGNTDHVGGVVDRVTRADSASLQPFRAAVESGVGAVMISSATYAKIDSKQQAVFSPKVIGLLRGWGYDGVVISDDLGVAASVRKVRAADRAVRFIAAGGDLVINANPALTKAMAQGLLARVKKDDAFAKRVTASAARVLTLKSRVGAYDCG